MMQIEWQPQLSEFFKRLGIRAHMEIKSDLPAPLDSIPDFAKQLAGHLYLAVLHVPFGKLRPAPIGEDSTLQAIEEMVTWCSAIIRSAKFDDFLAEDEDIARLELLRDTSLAKWSDPVAISSGVAVVEMVTAEQTNLPFIEHSKLPGAPHAGVLANGTNLVAACGMLQLNIALKKWANDDLDGALCAMSEAYSTLRETEMVIFQQWGQSAVLEWHSNVRRQGAIKRHAENYSLKNDVFEWYRLNKFRFTSMDAAAEEVVRSVSPVKFRTARKWIGECNRNLHPTS